MSGTDGIVVLSNAKGRNVVGLGFVVSSGTGTRAASAALIFCEVNGRNLMGVNGAVSFLTRIRLDAPATIFELFFTSSFFRMAIRRISISSSTRLGFTYSSWTGTVVRTLCTFRR